MKAVIEKFKDIPGYEGLYQVSNYGSVRSLRHQGVNRIKYLKPTKQQNGYEQVGLSHNGKTKWFKVHRLVWEAFIGKIPHNFQIDHIDGNKINNELSNLRVATPKENVNNPITRKQHLDIMRDIYKSDEWRKKCCKPIIQLTLDGDVIRQWNCARDAWRELGIGYSNISACCKCKPHCNTAGGFKWKFV